MTQSEGIALVTALTALIALTVGLIGNIKKLRDHVRSLISHNTQRKVNKMTKLYQQHCEAYQELPYIRQELVALKKLSVAIVRDQIIQKTRYHQDQGYISDLEADMLLSDFLEYHLNNGNGPILNYVTEIMRLPRTRGGEPKHFDMALTIDREIIKRSQSH